MLKNNKDLVTADDHTTIWRYMDFSSFYALLVNQKLFFKRLDQYTDQLEGQLPPETVIDYHSHRLGFPYTTKAEADQWIKNEMANIESFKPSILSNSWNMDTIENYAMWKIYLRGYNEGVAIETTVGKLRKQLDANPDFKHVYSGVVSYEPIPWNNINQFTVATNKRKPYAYEKEYRALILHEVTVKRNADGVQERVPNYKVGAEFKINTEELIDKIYVSPFAMPWFESALKVAIKDKLSNFDPNNIIGSALIDK